MVYIAVAKVARSKPLLSKNSIAAHPRFAQSHVDKLEGYWKNVLWTKSELFGLNKRQRLTLYSSIRTLSRCETWWWQIWAYFAAFGLGQLAIITEAMNF